MAIDYNKLIELIGSNMVREATELTSSSATDAMYYLTANNVDLNERLSCGDLTLCYVLHTLNKLKEAAEKLKSGKPAVMYVGTPISGFKQTKGFEVDGDFYRASGDKIPIASDDTPVIALGGAAQEYAAVDMIHAYKWQVRVLSNWAHQRPKDFDKYLAQAEARLSSLLPQPKTKKKVKNTPTGIIFDEGQVLTVTPTSYRFRAEGGPARRPSAFDPITFNGTFTTSIPNEAFYTVSGGQTTVLEPNPALAPAAGEAETEPVQF